MLLWSVLAVSVTARAGDSIAVVIPAGALSVRPGEVVGAQEVLYDPLGEYVIGDLYRNPNAWEDYEPRFYSGDEYYCWTKTHYHNGGDLPRYDYLIFSRLTESALAYVVRDGRLGNVLTNDDLQGMPGEKASMLLYLDPGETVTVYFRGRFSQTRWAWILYVTYVHQADAYLLRRTIRQGWVYFYLGILLSLLILSGLLYYFFRGRAVIYYAILLLGFGGYFYNLSSVTGLYPLSMNPFEGYEIELFILLIVTGLSGFTYHHLNLREHFPRLARFYLGTAGLTLLALGLQFIDAVDHDFAAQAGNLSILLLAIFTIVVIGLKARNGNRTEKMLFVSFGVLFLFSFFYLLNMLLQLIPVLKGKIFMWGTLGIAGIIFYGIYDKLTADIRENQRLTDQHQFRTRFFANITHEFRTPLTLILGPIRQLLERSREPTDRQLLSIADRNARRQLHLVNQILDLSRSEASRAVLEAEPVDLVPLLRRITRTYDSLTRQRQIRLDFTTDLDTLVAYAEIAKLETVLYNLLTNAFKFTPTDGRITVSLTTEPNLAVVTVYDSGHGIPSEALPHVFNRFYTDDRNAEEAVDSSGIGLALCRELVLLHGGTIGVESQEGRGTTFRVELPYEPGLLAVSVSESISAEPDLIDLDHESVPAREYAPAGPEKAPLILVVEDNTDMRTYIDMGLRKEFRVRTAPDGRAGLELAHQLLPDLIISDVMMPAMNGFELCLDLKTDIVTSHIPIILLTARSASRDRLHGLDTGADDYLVKPFEIKELLARTRNLIKSRRLLRERFSEGITLKPTEVTATPVDQQFLTAAMEAVEDRMDDESFGVDQLAQQLAMSRSSLNRKFRALLDRSTNQFIRGIRLEHAADLLQKTDDTVAIIAEKTGFGSATYFIKSFREKFGTTPGNYRK